MLYVQWNSVITTYNSCHTVWYTKTVSQASVYEGFDDIIAISLHWLLASPPSLPSQGIPPDDIFTDDFAIEDKAVHSDDDFGDREDGFHGDDGGEDAVRLRKRRRVELEDDSEMGSNFGTCYITC